MCFFQEIRKCPKIKVIAKCPKTRKVSQNRLVRSVQALEGMRQCEIPLFFDEMTGKDSMGKFSPILKTHSVED